ncbi:hypothetical protein BU15DRAFT_65619 [Melanogaster broomeanus]|nr:hypothetical protein BU15DRAFT_65619 [Melanogaster broomeanus]
MSSTSPNVSSPTSVYTFLATLVVLLIISSSIVVRSLILRRRHQALVEEAIRAGTWTAQHQDPRSGRRRRDFGEKPKLWETWTHSIDDDSDCGSGGKGKWIDIMPLYAGYINQSPSSTASRQAPLPESAANAIERQSPPARFLRPFSRRPIPPSSQPVTASPIAAEVSSSPSSSPTRSSSPAARVAVLIAMPSPAQKHNRDEDGSPVVEIGVVEIGVKDNDADDDA